jgi:hypothetical protein
MRCLKRYVAREVYKTLIQPAETTTLIGTVAA